jgi:hypothetical protein
MTTIRHHHPFKTHPMSGQRYRKTDFDPEAVDLLLLLVDEVVPRAAIDAWTQEERHAVGDWALRTHLRASDNLNRVPSKPECVRRDAVSLDQREYSETGTVMDLAPKGPA